MNYQDFIADKIITTPDAGFDIEELLLNSVLFPFQRFCVRRGLKKGRFAFFEDCGLGKTLQQLEWSHQVVVRTNGAVLIVSPLAIVPQTIQEGKRFGYEVMRFVPEMYTLTELPAGIYIVNYDQLHNINPDLFVGVVLDESSILKDYEGAFRNLIIEMFQDTPYKLACTATPSPNDPMELGNHSEFLGVMSRNEMLAMFFVHDGGDTSKWRLKKHARKDFYRWVNTWAIMLSKPSDIGFPDDGYILPALNLMETRIQTEARDGGGLFNSIAVSATNFNKELKLTIAPRLEEAVKYIRGLDSNCVIWIKQNEEGDMLKEMLPVAVEVRGSDSPEYKEKMLLGFANNEFPVLITKGKIARFGLNYQNCHDTVFTSPDFSFETIYQAIRRFLRFMQQHTVNVLIVTTDTMESVIEVFKKKQKQQEEMQREMQEAMKETFIEEQEPQSAEIQEFKGANFTARRGDCVQLIKDLPDESIGMTVFSPPFAELYTYSSHIEDMGNSKDYKQFVQHFGYLVPELYRVMWSGRHVVVHCMDLPIQKGKEGFIGLRDFSGMIRELFEAVGFIYHTRVTIWKDPVVEMQRTKALGLLHKQIKKDASMSRVGIPDYLMIFRKPGDHAHPVTHQDTDPSAPDYLPVDLWQKYASPVWYDIDYSDTLNYRSARDGNDEKHICPLQLPTINRSLHLWSNEGDTILTTFGGVGSEAFEAIKMKRKAILFELKQSYFDLAVKNCMEAELMGAQATLFNI